MALHTKAFESGVKMEDVYRHCSISRQAYFQGKERFERERHMMSEILKQVIGYRCHKDARAGSRSLFYNLSIKRQFGIGISKFERLMAVYGGTLMTLRTRVITTRSCWRSKKYPNLVSGLLVTGINVLVVGDLTYLAIGKYRYYLFCLTDVYSARIVGYCFHQRMRAEEAYRALMQWHSLRGASSLIDCLHHTDGGSQYFSDLYLGQMQKMQLKISVATNCLENGYAEQRNGLIKHHLLPTLKYIEGAKVHAEVKQAIHFYNHERKQENLGWQSPVEYEAYVLSLTDRPIKELHTFETR